MAHTNLYNGLDTRVGSTENSVANTYLRNGAYVTAPVIKDSNTTFTPGVSERRGTTTTFSHSGLKNADAQTSVSQAVNATQQYDAFGNLASSTGTWQGQFGYGGGFGYQQDATGLKLLGHRYYDASTGRFLTRDPIKDGRNWYVYVGNDPVGSSDPSGLVKVILFWYEVAVGGNHAGIIILDNLKNNPTPIWSFAGGPENHGSNPFTQGKLVSRSGAWAKGTQDFARWNGGGVVLVNDDSPANYWLAELSAVEEEMKRVAKADYFVTPDPENGQGNSNSWAREMVDRAFLTGAYERAIAKRGGAPWIPGWSEGQL